MNMKIKFTSAGVALLAAVTTCALGINGTYAQNFKTITPGTLTIGSDQVYPPYDYQENGVTKGLDAEVMTILAPKLGVKLKFLDVRFASLIPGLQANRFDLIASALYVTPARAKVVDYVPYAKTGGSLMVRADDSFAPKKPEDLCGKKVANLKGAAWVPELLKVSQTKCTSNPMEVKEFGTSAEAAQALLARGADVVFDDAGVSKAAVVASNNRLKITSTDILFPVVIGMAVKKGNDELLNHLKTEFELLKSTDEYRAILTKYNLALPTDAEFTAALIER